MPQDATNTNNILSSVNNPTPIGNIISTPNKRGNDLKIDLKYSRRNKN